jgi:tetratricopeptide (TPR) repeat protein
MLAADAREEGDGKQFALAKVVAGLLGVSSDDIFRRAERDRRRKGRARNGIAAVLAMLVVMASASAVYAWQQLKTNEAFLTATLKTTTEIVNTAVSQAETFGVPRKATLALLSKAEGLFDNMALLGRPTPELRFQKAWMLIQFARNYEALGDTTKQNTRSEAALEIMTNLAPSAPDNTEYQMLFGAALIEKGKVFKAQGDLPEALDYYKSAFDVVAKLTKAHGDNHRLLRDVAVASDRVGDTLREQGRLSEALDREQLVKAKPNNIDWLGGLAITYHRAGEVLEARGLLHRALQAYRQSLDIMLRLTKDEPDDAKQQDGVAIVYDQVGDILRDQGKFALAQEAYEKSFAIRERLALPTLPTRRTSTAFPFRTKDSVTSFERLGNSARR